MLDRPCNTIVQHDHLIYVYLVFGLSIQVRAPNEVFLGRDVVLSFK